MKRAILLLTIVLIPVLAPGIGAQSRPDERLRFAPEDTVSALVLAIEAGYAHYVMPHEAPFGIDRPGYGFSAALEWHPGARLRLALESGWTTFYSYELTAVDTPFGTTDASLSLSAVPLLAVFSMPIISSFTLHGGTGGYFVRSHATSFGETVDVVRFAQGWVAAASWDGALTGSVRLGATLKWYGATEFGDGSLLLQLRLVLPLLTY